MKTPTAAVLTDDPFFLDSVSYFLTQRGYAVLTLLAPPTATAGPSADLYVVRSGQPAAEAVLQHYCPPGASGRLVVYNTGCTAGGYQRLAYLGAHGCLTAGDGLAELLTCVEFQARGERYESTRARQLLATPTAPAPNSCWQKLSPQERNVFAFIGQGLGSKEIAEALFVSAHTVKNHKSNIARKLNIGSCRELLSMALSLAGEFGELGTNSYSYSAD